LVLHGEKTGTAGPEQEADQSFDRLGPSIGDLFAGTAAAGFKGARIIAFHLILVKEICRATGATRAKRAPAHVFARRA